MKIWFPFEKKGNYIIKDVCYMSKKEEGKLLNLGEGKLLKMGEGMVKNCVEKWVGRVES